MFLLDSRMVESDPRWSEEVGPSAAAIRWLVSGPACDSEGGCIALLTLAPGATVPPHRTPAAERLFYVFRGSVSLAGSQGPAAVGQAFYVPPDHAVGLQAGADSAELLMIIGGIADPGQIRWEAVDEGAAEPPVVVDVDDLPAEPIHDPERGFHHMSAQWIVDGSSHGAEHLLVGQTTFKPGSFHDLHSHPNGAEFVFVHAGDGMEHLTEDEAVQLEPGMVTHVTEGEVHGTRNSSPTETGVAIFGFLGVAALDRTGYEVAGTA